MKQVRFSALLLIVDALLLGQATISAQSSAPDHGSQSVLTVQAVLNKAVDSKRAKQGDKIEAKLSEGIRSSSGAEVPRGAKLLGHVIDAKGHTKEDRGSRLGIVFDEVALKNGESIPFHAFVVAVAPPPPAPSVATSNMDSAATGGMAAPSSTPRAGSSPPPSENAGVTRSEGRFGGVPANVQVNGNSRGAIGLPGVTLQSQNSGPPAATVLTSNDQNIKLENGTRLVLQLQP